jgi:CBS domain-containing protein
MGNVIIDRVAFFLKDYPPFSFLDTGELEHIAHHITVKHARKEEFLFKEGEPNKGFCYILRQGNVRLYQQQGAEQQLIDQCEPGDIFGVRSILSEKAYVMTAQCEEDSLLYALEVSTFRKFLESHQKFALFFASGYASGQAVVRGENQELYLKKVTAIKELPLQYSENVITCAVDTTVQDAAALMQQAGVGSIVIADTKNCPLGIVTDTDLRNKVVAGALDLNTQVSAIMSSPVKTIAPHSLLSEVQIEMIRSQLHHLILTRDGSDATEIVGIVSDHDIMLSMQNHPAALIKAIRYSDDPDRWAEIRDSAETLVLEYLEQEVSVSLISNLVTSINDTIIEKAISHALEKFPEAEEISFAWLSLGSEGREEQLLRTDQDNAIVFEDQEDNTKAQETLLKVAELVTEILEKCGFEKCPADIMASNPKFCQPLSAWKKYFSNWIENPEPNAVMNSTIFFDYRTTYGNIKLQKALDEHLEKTISKHRIFLNHLAQNARQNPAPLSFFKKFVVEKSGEHKDNFDIKKRAMMPLSDAARVLCLESGSSTVHNTVDRFRHLANVEASKAKLYEEAAQAYEIFMRIRAINGVKNQDSGRFIDIESMNKLEKQILKNAFLPISDLQDMMEIRFQLAYFN